MNYNEFKNEVSSEKITLATLEPSKRLIAFSVHSGSVYKIENFDYAVISTIKENDSEFSEVSSLAAIEPNSFYNDRENKILYLETEDSGNPNSKFLHMSFKLFFSSAPVTLPHDLASGFEVFWEPQIASTSFFGVEIDTINQQNETIEGAGSLKLFNDQEFWPANFDKLFFENQNCKVYSWNRSLLPSEAKLIFKGKVEAKEYTSGNITFKMKDLMSQLRNAVSLKDISELEMRHPANLAKAKQRLIFGRVFGFRPTNLDSTIDNKYPLTGTVAINATETTLNGTGTQFLKELSPDDRLILNNTEYTIASVSSDTSLELTEPFDGDNLSGYSTQLIPEAPKRFINRVWCVAGHPLRQPTTTVQGGSSTSLVFLVSTRDMFDGDFIYFGELGSGELVQIDEVINATQVRLSTSLSVNPVPGTTVFRPSVQQLMINDVRLVYERDYSLDPETAILTLSDDAEKNAAPTRESTETATFTNGSRTVTGSGTFFKSYLSQGYLVRPKGTSEWLEVLTVNSDTEITLRSAPSGLTPNPKTAILQFKSLVFDASKDVLHCEVIGRTTDNTISGNLLRKAPEIINQLLLDAGFETNEIDASSFVDSQTLVPEDLGFAVPQNYDDKSSLTYRDVINWVNKSVFGLVFQGNDFKMKFDVLRPVIPASPHVIKESDCLSWTCTSTNKNMLKRAIVEYRYREYDFSIKTKNTETVENSSDLAKFILGTSREKVFNSVLIDEEDAQRLCDRWRLLLEFSTNSIKIQTKLQLIDAEINDVIDFEHRKFYERFSGTSKRKFLAIEKIQKNGLGVEIECVDLSNAFNRIALITDISQNWSNSGEEEKIRSGYYSDDNGLIENSENSFQVNLIW